MHIETIRTLREYKNFIRALYKNEAWFKDNKSGLLPIVCGKNAPFYRNSVQRMAAVKDGDGRTLCQAVFVQHVNAPHLVTVAFFEALPDVQAAVDLLIGEARDFARLHGAQKIIAGLDGHCNHSVGFGRDSSHFPSFGESFNKDWYPAYFQGWTPIRLISFEDSLFRANAQIVRDLARVKERSSDIVYEKADFGALGFAGTMKRYTDLNNLIFKDQRYYFKREYSEDADLFHSMRPLLKDENLIFAKKDGADIGFILWYPDFNELVVKGHGASVWTFIQYKIFGRTPRSAKVVEIGLVDGLRNTRIILMLFAMAITAAFRYPRMNRVLSSWILDENTPSKNITQRYAKNRYKEFIAYEKDV